MDMAEAHFIAQTYLHRFVDAKAMLHAYRKSDGKAFPCHPRTVCREWDGDLNTKYLAHPKALADFRKLYESEWNPTVDALIARSVSAEHKFIAAAHFAALITATPAWRRCMAQMLADHAKDKLIADKGRTQ